MNRIAAIVLMAFACIGAGCTQAEIDADMAKAKAVMAAINNGARVTADAVKQGIDAACANQQAVYIGANGTRTILIQQNGPNTQENITNLDRALAAYNNACAAASAGSTPSAAILRTAISAYQSVKAAQAAGGAS